MRLGAVMREAETRLRRAIEVIGVGGMVILMDDEERENEGDLVFAAAKVTPEKVNFMAREGRGLICLSLPAERIAQLGLELMVSARCGQNPRGTAFTVSIDAREGVTTGISANDRARTIAVASDPSSSADDLVVPGHVFPLRAAAGGVSARRGHTEGAAELVRMAGLPSGAVICEIMKDDGTMARLPDLEMLSKKFGLPIVHIADIGEGSTQGGKASSHDDKGGCEVVI